MYTYIYTYTYALYAESGAPLGARVLYCVIVLCVYMYTFAVLYSSVTLYIDRHTYAMCREFIALLGARVLYCVIVLCVICMHLQC